MNPPSASPSPIVGYDEHLSLVEQTRAQRLLNRSAINRRIRVHTAPAETPLSSRSPAVRPIFTRRSARESRQPDRLQVGSPFVRALNAEGINRRTKKINPWITARDNQSPEDSPYWDHGCDIGANYLEDTLNRSPLYEYPVDPTSPSSIFSPRRRIPSALPAAHQSIPPPIQFQISPPGRRATAF